jgi:hypothetical protein
MSEAESPKLKPKLRLNPGHTKIVMDALGGKDLQQYKELKEDLNTEKYFLKRVRSPHEDRADATEMFLDDQQLSDMFSGDPEDKIAVKSELVSALYQQIANTAASVKGDAEHLVEYFDYVVEKGQFDVVVADIRRKSANMSEQLDLVLSIADQAANIYEHIHGRAEQEEAEYDEAMRAWGKQRNANKEQAGSSPKLGPYAEYVRSYNSLVENLETAQELYSITQEVLKSRLIESGNTLEEGDKQAELEILKELLDPSSSKDTEG